MREACETCSVELSALMDRALAPAEIAPVVDHLVGCAECREFWAAARGLDAALESLRGCAEADLPPGLWRRIEEAARTAAADDGSGERSVVRLPGRRRVVWGICAAATLVAGVWLGTFLAPSVRPVRPGEAVLEVRAVGSEARMGEDQLLDVARGLLRADPRDRAALLEILEAVERRQHRREGSVDRTASDDLAFGSSVDEDRGPQYATY